MNFIKKDTLYWKKDWFNHLLAYFNQSGQQDELDKDLCC